MTKNTVNIRSASSLKSADFLLTQSLLPFFKQMTDHSPSVYIKLLDVENQEDNISVFRENDQLR
jgi:hypothetical protein